MHITESNLRSASTALHYQRQSTAESLQIEVGRSSTSGRPPARDESRVSLSNAAQEAESAAAVADETEGDQLDPRLRVLINIVEALTGRKVVFYQDGQDGDRTAANALTNQATDPGPQNDSKVQRNDAPRRQGPDWSIRYESHSVREEAEIAHYSASGQVKLADGRQIDFALELEMARYEREESHVLIELGSPKRKDPLVLNLSTPHANLSAERFDFDLNSDGETESIAKLGQGSAYLAIDRNGDDAITQGSELFGPRSNEGFAELAELDQDGNGWIDEADAAFSSLKLWRPGEAGLQSLAEAGVGAIALANRNTPFTLKDETGHIAGAIRSTGVFLFEDGRVGTAQQIDLVV